MRATLDHFEIPVADSDRLAVFFESVFGWVGEEPARKRYRRLAPPSVGPDSTQPAVRVGLLEGSPEVLDRAVPVVRLSGETLELCLGRVASAGGRIILEPKSVGSSGRFARFEDPEGNQWGLWEPSPAP